MCSLVSKYWMWVRKKSLPGPYKVAIDSLCLPKGITIISEQFNHIISGLKLGTHHYDQNNEMTCKVAHLNCWKKPNTELKLYMLKRYSGIWWFLIYVHVTISDHHARRRHIQERAVAPRVLHVHELQYLPGWPAVHLSRREAVLRWVLRRALR